MASDPLPSPPFSNCFVLFETHEQAVAAESILASVQLDGRRISVELDAGWKEGRKYSAVTFSNKKSADDNPTKTEYSKVETVPFL